MQDWSISKRIGAITATLLGALTLVALTGIVATLLLSNRMQEMNTAGKEFELTAGVLEDLFESRMAELAYRSRPSAELVDEFRSNVEEVNDVAAQHGDELGKDDILGANWDAVFGAKVQFAAAFDDIVELQQEREDAIAAKLAAETVVQDALASFANTIMFDSNARAEAQLDVAEAEFLNSRIAIEGFLLTNLAADFTNASDAMERANRAVENIQSTLSNAGRLEQLASIQTALANYWTAASSAHAAIVARNDLRAEMTGLAMTIDQEIAAIETELALRQTNVAENASRTSFIVQGVLVIGGLAALLLGFLIAARVSKGITSSIAASVDTMKTLADGDLDVEIDGSDAEHELGDVARALVVFRDNGKEARALQEQQLKAEEDQRKREVEQAEREKLAEEERQRKAEEERKRVILSLKNSIGSVVQAAAAGDFGKRIDTHFDEPELQEMAGAVNQLVDNVEAGVSETARVMAQMAEGNLSDRMIGDFAGKFAELQSNVNGTIDNLSQLVREIASQCMGLGQEVNAMTNQASDLARRAEQQAASLEESSAVMEEMSASAKSSAEGASNASTRASEASNKVEEAGEIVQSAVQAMADIRTASQSIGEIVSVIDGIAFQTNLLALNASVEAARAGSAGKGFAVVATEVRALAQRSGEASQDIKRLIDESSTQVNRGVELVEKTGDTLNEIVGGVREMSTMMEDLATTAQEQATGVAEASNAITQMDAITQKNAALADESRETAGKVRHQAETMEQMVGTFRTSSQDTGEQSRMIAAE